MLLSWYDLVYLVFSELECECLFMNYLVLLVF